MPMRPHAVEVKQPVTGEPPADVLSIVIPAYNEEEAIRDTIARCEDAAREIRDAAGLAAVEIIVVSDGSTDRTVEIARSFPGVRVVAFEHNRGYGAAIKEGFRCARGTLLGFLDADGTCEPRCFGVMCRRARAGVDVVVGSRLGPGSRMPRTRRLGNRLFALLLGFLCGRRVTDTASGMRVIRRRALAWLEPLPDGMHFTPAISARALLNDLEVCEVPMPYEERVGTSKLRVFSDGLLFLRAIVAGVLCYRPERLLLIGFTVCMVLGLCLAAYPTEFYLRHGRIEEWMIYRFLVCFLLGSVGWPLLGGAALASRMRSFGPRRRDQDSFWSALPARLFEGRRLAALAAVTLAASGWLLWPGAVEYVTSGAVTLHWSRVVTGLFGVVLVAQAFVIAVLLRVLAIWKTQTETRRDGERGRSLEEDLACTVQGPAAHAPGPSPAPASS